MGTGRGPMEKATAVDWLVIPPAAAEEEKGLAAAPGTCVTPAPARRRWGLNTASESHAGQGAPIDVVGVAAAAVLGDTEGSQCAAPASVHAKPPSVLEQLFAEHRKLLADVADLRADHDFLVSCVEAHGIQVSKRLKCAHQQHRDESSCPLEKVLELPRPAAKILASAGQLAWALSLRASSSARSSAKAVQEERLLICGGIRVHTDYRQRLSSAESLDLRGGEWEVEPSLPWVREGCVSVVIGGSVYVCGGLPPLGRSVLHFDLAHRCWRPTACMQKQRAWPGAIVRSGSLYLIGGIGGRDRAEDTLECFQPKTRTWTMTVGMTKQNRWLGAAVPLQGDKVLLCGGIESLKANSADGCTDADREIARSAEVFSFSSRMSHAIGSMAQPRIFHGALTVNDQIIAFGGSIPGTGVTLKAAELYDPSADSWSECADFSLRWPLSAFAYLVTDGSLYVLGGTTRDVIGHVAEDSVQCLDLATGIWKDLPPLSRRGSFTVAVITCGPTKATNGRF